MVGPGREWLVWMGRVIRDAGTGNVWDGWPGKGERAPATSDGFEVQWS